MVLLFTVCVSLYVQYFILLWICICIVVVHKKWNSEQMLICFFFDWSLFETMQTLFWTVFGVIDMNQFNLSNIESFTKFSAKTILGIYTVITNVVLLNLLIAMLNNSYQLISVSIWSLYILHMKVCFLYYSQCKNTSNPYENRRI